MKLFICTTSLIITFWAININTAIIKNDGIFQPINTELENNRNNGFKGLWVNEDDHTKMITKCEILYKDNSYVVHMWGSCQPQDCDWGENVADQVKKETDNFELLWDQEFAESHITYEILEGKLKMTHKRSYKDNSGRPDHTLVEYFVKQ